MLISVAIASLGLAVASDGENGSLSDRFRLIRAMSGPKEAWLLLLDEIRPEPEAVNTMARELREEALASPSLEVLCERMNELLAFVFVARNSGWPMREGAYWRDLRSQSYSFRDLLWKARRIDLPRRSNTLGVPSFGPKNPIEPDFVSIFGTQQLRFENGECGSMWSFDADRRLILVRIEETNDRFEVIPVEAVSWVRT